MDLEFFDPHAARGRLLEHRDDATPLLVSAGREQERQQGAREDTQDPTPERC